MSKLFYFFFQIFIKIRKMDFLKEVIAQKRKQVEDIAIEERAGAKMIRRADLFKKEKEAYLERQRQLEKEQQLDINSKNADELIDKKLSTSTSENVPRSEVIRQLRIRGQPIRLFGESDSEALKRLRKLEIEKPDLNEGWKNDFQAAMDQVENEEILEKIVKGTSGANEAEKLNVQIEENENDATWEQIFNGASSLGSGDDNKDCDLIHAFIQYILKRWAKDLNERDENIKKSARGKLQAGMHKQTVEHLGPLVHSLVKHSVNSDIRVHLTNIARFCILDRNYIEANNAYMEMAIGNAPWPVGVTRSGIHQRPGSSKAYASNVAHVMNDETQRKYVHGIKRILSKCQEFFPADPSKCVEFVKSR